MIKLTLKQTKYTIWREEKTNQSFPIFLGLIKCVRVGIITKRNLYSSLLPINIHRLTHQRTAAAAAAVT